MFLGAREGARGGASVRSIFSLPMEQATCRTAQQYRPCESECRFGVFTSRKPWLFSCERARKRKFNY